MYLFFDVETNGLPKDYKASIEDIGNWPRIVQIAWALYSEEYKLVESESYIIKEVKIPDKLTEIHGISESMSSQYGYWIDTALDRFACACGLSQYFIAHNIRFDRKIIQCEFFRHGERKSPFPEDKEKLICTMFKSTKFCGLRNVKGGAKWPKLEELYLKLFNCEMEGCHNALFDVMATAKCFFKLKEIGVI